MERRMTDGWTELAVSGCESDSSITQVTQLSAGENLSFIENEPDVRPTIPQFESEDWYTQPCFRRYWQHYQQVTAWCQKHYQLMRQQQALDYAEQYSVYGMPFNYLCQNTHNTTDQRKSVRTGADKGSGNTKKRKENQTQYDHPCHSKKQSVRKKKTSTDIKQDGTSCSVSELSSSVEVSKSDIDLTEEMIQFFSHTQEHRKQRDESKKHEKTHVSEDILVNIESVFSHHKPRTVAPPKQRPGSQRTAEMKILYGKGAAMIHGMETALQMTFDRNTDLYQPKYWPNMPLKVVFG